MGSFIYAGEGGGGLCTWQKKHDLKFSSTPIPPHPGRCHAPMPKPIFSPIPKHLTLAKSFLSLRIYIIFDLNPIPRICSHKFYPFPMGIVAFFQREALYSGEIFFFSCKLLVSDIVVLHHLLTLFSIKICSTCAKAELPKVPRHGHFLTRPFLNRKKYAKSPWWLIPS